MYTYIMQVATCKNDTKCSCISVTTCMHVYIHNTHTVHMHICTYVCIHLWRTNINGSMWEQCIMCVKLHVLVLSYACD